MHIKYYILIIGILLISCKTKNTTINKTDKTTNTQNQEYLIGNINIKDLKQNPHISWYNANYERYILDTTALEKIKNQDLLKDITITIFLGTWCRDTKHLLPRFYKILDSIGYNTNKIRLIGVDKEKNSHDGLSENLNIDYVPTFIFYKDKKELNRIVEFTVESLELDMLKILKNDGYKHFYKDVP
jgi:thiol-disulfide isomerase/thioredoxin